ncbi:MAG: hypothetical protein AB7G93_23570 [Bdellovibrionales bacterium]
MRVTYFLAIAQLLHFLMPNALGETNQGELSDGSDHKHQVCIFRMTGINNGSAVLRDKEGRKCDCTYLSKSPHTVYIVNNSQGSVFNYEDWRYSCRPCDDLIVLYSRGQESFSAKVGNDWCLEGP